MMTMIHITPLEPAFHILIFFIFQCFECIFLIFRINLLLIQLIFILYKFDAAYNSTNKIIFEKFEKSDSRLVVLIQKSTFFYENYFLANSLVKIFFLKHIANMNSKSEMIIEDRSVQKSYHPYHHYSGNQSKDQLDSTAKTIQPTEKGRRKPTYMVTTLPYKVMFLRFYRIQVKQTNTSQIGLRSDLFCRLTEVEHILR